MSLNRAALQVATRPLSRGNVDWRVERLTSLMGEHWLEGDGTPNASLSCLGPRPGGCLTRSVSACSRCLRSQLKPSIVVSTTVDLLVFSPKDSEDVTVFLHFWGSGLIRFPVVHHVCGHYFKTNGLA